MLASATMHIVLIGWLVWSVGVMPAVPPAPEFIAVSIVEPAPTAVDIPDPVPPQPVSEPTPAPAPTPYMAPVIVDRDVPIATMAILPPLPTGIDDVQILPAPPRLRPDTAPRVALMPPYNPAPEMRRGEAAPIGLTKPPYPREARKLGQQGAVTVRATIDKNGRAAECAIVESSGFYALDQAARGAVLAARYRPAHIDGIPCDADLSLRFRFRLDD